MESDDRSNVLHEVVIQHFSNQDLPISVARETARGIGEDITKNNLRHYGKYCRLCRYIVTDLLYL